MPAFGAWPYEPGCCRRRYGYNADWIPFQAYLAQLEKILRTGQATEPSYYPVLQSLLEGLDSGVIAIINRKKTQHGSPDLSIKRKKNILEFPVGWLEAKDRADSPRAPEKARLVSPADVFISGLPGRPGEPYGCAKILCRQGLATS